MRGVNRAKGADRTRGRQDPRDVGGRDGFYRGGTLGSAEPLAGDEEDEREDGAERHAYPRAEDTLLDGIANEQHAAERQREPPNPNGPARAEPLLKCNCRRRRL